MEELELTAESEEVESGSVEDIFIDDKTDMKGGDESTPSGEAETLHEASPEAQTEEGAPNVPDDTTNAQAIASEAGREARAAMFTELLEAYPEVIASDIPPEVLREGIESGRLKTFYEAHLYRTLKAELERERQSLQNARRSAGSRKSAGGMSVSEFDRLWNEN